MIMDSSNVIYVASRAGYQISSAKKLAIMVDSSGHMIASLQGAVPRGWPQTPQAAEHLGLLRSVERLQGPARLIGDCHNVVVAGQAHLDAAPLFGGAYGLAHRRSHCQFRAQWQLVESVNWTRAHQSRQDHWSPQEVWEHQRFTCLRKLGRWDLIGRWEGAAQHTVDLPCIGVNGHLASSASSPRR